MNLETIKEQYPINYTWVGFYGTDQQFEASSIEDVENIENWDFAPLDWGFGTVPFIIYTGNNNFDCCYFSYKPVCGYFYDYRYPNKVLLISDWSDCDSGYEITDPKNYDDQHIVIAPDITKYETLEEAAEYNNMIKEGLYPSNLWD